MGTGMAPAYVHLFMKYLEQDIIATSPKQPKIQWRFIDDNLMIWSHGIKELDNFMALANNLHLTIKILSISGCKPDSIFFGIIICRGRNNYILTRTASQANR